MKITPQLQVGTLLQDGKYRILSVLGKGGFGITYLAEQVMLQRKVAIKEFFLQDLCDRDETSSHMTIGTASARETVEAYRDKFLKEARNLATLKHPNIVGVFDVFMENGTAYYAMDYIEGGSLSEKVKAHGYLPEPMATRLITEVGSALACIHDHNMMHLDVKPGNIMLNADDSAVLIDFGLSKQYDTESGNQTSTTPIGITDGYAPLEQYRRGGVSTFSPETDIYALGATFFYMLTGTTPPCAADVNEYGVPVGELQAKGVSPRAISVICGAMGGRKSDRMKDARSFISCLQESNLPPFHTSVTTQDETTQFLGSEEWEKSEDHTNNFTLKVLIAVLLGILCIACALIGYIYLGSGQALSEAVPTDSVATIDSVALDTTAIAEEPEPEPAGPDREAIYQGYSNTLDSYGRSEYDDEYFLLDMTGDGIPELCAYREGSHLSEGVDVYTYQGNQVVKVFEAGFAIASGSNFFITYYSGMGEEHYWKVSCYNGQFVQKEIHTKELGVDDGWKCPGHDLQTYKKTNKAPIRRALGI